MPARAVGLTRDQAEALRDELMKQAKANEIAYKVGPTANAPVQTLQEFLVNLTITLLTAERRTVGHQGAQEVDQVLFERGGAQAFLPHLGHSAHTLDRVTDQQVDLVSSLTIHLMSTYNALARAMSEDMIDYVVPEGTPPDGVVGALERIVKLSQSIRTQAERIVTYTGKLA